MFVGLCLLCDLLLISFFLLFLIFLIIRNAMQRKWFKMDHCIVHYSISSSILFIWNNSKIYNLDVVPLCALPMFVKMKFQFEVGGNGSTNEKLIKKRLNFWKIKCRLICCNSRSNVRELNEHWKWLKRLNGPHSPAKEVALASSEHGIITLVLKHSICERKIFIVTKSKWREQVSK